MEVKLRKKKLKSGKISLYLEYYTETYLIIGPFSNKMVAKSVLSYTQTRFFHFLVSLVKITQNAMKKAYSLVPIQDFSETWTDEKLYQKYGLTEEEITYIERRIRPMK